MAECCNCVRSFVAPRKVGLHQQIRLSASGLARHINLEPLAARRNWTCSSRMKDDSCVGWVSEWCDTRGKKGECCGQSRCRGCYFRTREAEKVSKINIRVIDYEAASSPDPDSHPHKQSGESDRPSLVLTANQFDASKVTIDYYEFPCDRQQHRIVSFVFLRQHRDRPSTKVCLSVYSSRTLCPCVHNS